MSDHHRRLLCRAGFLLGCVLPTLIVVQWILFPRSVGHWHGWARQTLGCRVEIGSVATPTPRQVVLERLRLHVAANAEPLQIAAATIRSTLDGPEIELAPLELSIDQLAALLDRWLFHAGLGIDSDAAVTVRIPRINVHADPHRLSGTAPLVLHDCRIRWEPGERQPLAILEFNPESATHAVRCQWQAGSTGSPAHWSIDTSSALLPCWLVESVSPAAIQLGDQAWFSGRIEGERARGGSAITAHNVHLLNVDVGRLLRAASQPQQINWKSPIAPGPESRFDATLAEARWSDGRIESLFAEFRCLTGGQIDGAWLAATEQWLHVQVADNRPASGPIEFAQLLVGFEIRAGELYVWGRRHDGLIASGLDQQPLIVATPMSQRLSPQNLAVWLSGDSRLQLPVSTAALQVLSHLPPVR